MQVNDSSPPPVTLEVQADRLVRSVFLLCVSIELFIAFSDVFLNHHHWVPWSPLRRFFNITREDGLGNWWSTMQTMLVALVLWAIVFVQARQRAAAGEDGGGSRWKIIGWTVIAGFFSFMSLDDGSKLHERLGSTWKKIVDAGAYAESRPRFEEWFPSYSWQLVVAPFFIVMGFFIAAFLWRELRSVRARMMVFAALTILAVAMGMDFLEGTDSGVFDDDDVKHYMKMVEETMEMLANTVFLCVFVRVLTDRWPNLDVRFR